MTFKEIQDDILLDSQELQGIPDYNIDVVKHIANRIYLDIVRQLKCIEDVIDITTVADQASYTATDAAKLAYVYKPYLVRYIDSGVTENGEILTPYPGGYSNLPETLKYGTPRQYWTRGVHTRGEFEIGTWPVASDSSDTIRVTAYMFPTSELSSDSDQPLIKDAWQDLIVEGSIWRIFRRYAHLNGEWRKKALEFKAYYESGIDEARGDMFTESDDLNPQVLDIYDRYDNLE